MSPGRVLIDAGPIVALLADRDSQHAACEAVARRLSLPALTCWPVITEAAYLLRHSPALVRQLLSLCDGSRFQILAVDSADLQPINAILAKYEDQQPDLADAVLMHLAERERIDIVFTLDRQDFSIYRTASGRSLQLLPA